MVHSDRPKHAYLIPLLKTKQLLKRSRNSRGCRRAIRKTPSKKLLLRSSLCLCKCFHCSNQSNQKPIRDRNSKVEMFILFTHTYLVVVLFFVFVYKFLLRVETKMRERHPDGERERRKEKDQGVSSLGCREVGIYCDTWDKHYSSLILPNGDETSR